MILGDRLLKIIEEGLKGDRKGLALGNLPKLQAVTSGLQRSRTYLIAGGTGAGKSTWGMNVFGVEPLLDYYYNYRKDPKYVFHWFINSLEMDIEMLLTRITSYILFRDYDLSVDAETIAGIGGKVISTDIRELIEVEIAPVLNDLSEYITVHHRISSKKLSQILTDFYIKHGTLVRDKQMDVTGYSTEKIVIVNVSNDHVALMSSDSSKKAAIDELAKLSIEFKTMFGTTFTHLQQLNRQEGEIQKLKTMDTPQPMLQDIKDSSDLADSSDVVIAVFPPHRFGIKYYLKYDISDSPDALRDSYRAMWVLKNRSGKTGVISYAFYGASGFFRELPSPESFTAKMKRLLRENKPFWK